MPSWTKFLSLHPLADGIDRLNYLITALMVFIFSIIVFAKQFFGSPVECWTESEFKEEWDQYVESFCFGDNTYTLPSKVDVPDFSFAKKSSGTSIYQYVPLFLAIQAIMFFLPNFVWLMLHKLSGIDLQFTTSDKVSAERIATYLHDATNRRIFKCIKGNWFATALYFSTKIAYIANLLFQMLLIAYIMGNGNLFWAFTAFNSPAFPQEVHCDVEVQIVANIGKHTVPCTLTINGLNETIYRFLWLWFLAVLSVSIVNLIYTAYLIFTPSARFSAFKRWLSTHQTSTEDGENLMVNRFAVSRLQQDTFLAMRFIEAEAGAIVINEVAAALLQKFTDELPLANDTPSTAV